MKTKNDNRFSFASVTFISSQFGDKTKKIVLINNTIDANYEQ